MQSLQCKVLQLVMKPPSVQHSRSGVFNSNGDACQNFLYKLDANDSIANKFLVVKQNV